jgi:hypothetical protein
MIESGTYSTGRFIVIYPKQNYQCEAAVKSYQKHLVSNDPEASGFQAVTLDDCVDTFRAIGDQETANALHGRYLDFERVEKAIFE